MFYDLKEKNHNIMNIIKILRPDQAQKIAAGEVIERPSNVVKELVENSIDARATQISLFIDDAGKSLIRIVDNGCGMSSEDAQLCFLPHATSKITSLDDIEIVNSFGFRGEALASISAISMVTLATKLNELSDSDTGVKIEFADGKIQNVQATSCNIGTDIQIKDIFYNVPVRKKFLKQDETEWNQIQAIFHAFCLSHVNIHFKLFRDNKMILNAPVVADVKTRVTQIWGNNVSQNLLELHNKKSDENWVNFTGYISNHNFWRYGKTHIFLFVNNRWVKNIELSKGLFKGYLNVLPPDKSPAAFIFAEIDKNLVDINCHPKKEEVRFLKPLSVQTKLQELVKFTLEANISAQLSYQMPVSAIGPVFAQKNLDSKFNSFGENIGSPELNFSKTFFAGQGNKFQDFAKFDNATFLNGIDYKSSVINYKQIEADQAQSNLQFDEDANKNMCWKNFKIIGQLFKTYIMLEHGDDLIIIDQHAAHERILYEKILKNFEKKDGVRLIFPEILKLTAYQIKLLTEQQVFLQNQGVTFEIFGEAEIAIKSGPVGLAQASLKELILEIINFVEENEHFDQEEFRKKLNEHMHSHLACKLAVKAGDQLSEAQMENLLQELQKTEKRFICVHGRPTTWAIKKYALEKNFRRK